MFDRGAMMMMMQGTVVRYSATSRLSALISQRTEVRCSVLKGLSAEVRQELRPPRSGLAVIFLPGLTDGLLALDYVAALDDMLSSMRVALVQPLLSSSYVCIIGDT